MLGSLSPFGDHVKSKTVILEKHLSVLEKPERRSLISIVVTIFTTSIEFCSIRYTRSIIILVPDKLVAIKDTLIFICPMYGLNS